jgi:outer membrane receptor protein involved in Fe transport
VGGADVDVTYFRTAVRDRVTNARATFPAASRPVTASGTAVGSVASSANAGQATIEGLETRLAYDVGAALGRPYALRATLNATRLFRAQERTRTVRVDVARFAGARDFDATDIFAALVFSDTTARARIRNVAALTVDGAFEYDDARRFVARLGGRYVGRRLDNDFSDPADFSDVEYPPFLVADLLAGVRLSPRVRADLLVNNLTDENYYEKRGYNLAGRVVQLRLTTGF